MKIALLGYDRQGRSALKYWSRDGNEITICDKNKAVETPKGVPTQLGEHYLANLHEFDVLVRTPGIHPAAIQTSNPDSPDILEKTTTVTNEFFRVCPTKNIIGVTGTKGKGTTSTLIANMLEAAGKNVHLGGNIGIPPLDMLEDAIEPDDWVILELANYQLIDLAHSPHIALCLMIEPEHLDWHKSLDEYLRAKQQLFLHQTEQDIAIYKNDDNRSMHIARSSLGKHVAYFSEQGAHVQENSIVIDDIEVCSLDDVALTGAHNYENVCAAVTAVWQVTQDTAVMRQAISTFSGLPFRIEPRGTHNGIDYYNDSFATAPGAAIAAIRAIPNKKVMIVGGYDRGLDFQKLAEIITKPEANVRKVVLIGASAQRIANTFDEVGYADYVVSESTSMQEILQRATKEAQTGDAVVLSPACASFDMFKNFEVRGQAFNEAVENL